MRVCWTPQQSPLAQDNPHAVRERAYPVRVSVSVWAEMVGNIDVCPHLLSERVDCLKMPRFSGNCSTGDAYRRACSCETQFVVSARRSSSELWGRYAAVVGCDISRKVDWSWIADCMTSSVAGSNSDGFLPAVTPERRRFCSPSQDYRRSHCMTSSSFDNGRCQHVPAYLIKRRPVH
jgi:hypothetical protein